MAEDLVVKSPQNTTAVISTTATAEKSGRMSEDELKKKKEAQVFDGKKSDSAIDDVEKLSQKAKAEMVEKEKEAQAKKEAEAKAKAEKEAQAKKEAEAKAKAEAEAKALLETTTKEKEKKSLFSIIKTTISEWFNETVKEKNENNTPTQQTTPQVQSLQQQGVIQSTTTPNTGIQGSNTQNAQPLNAPSINTPSIDLSNLDSDATNRMQLQEIMTLAKQHNFTMADFRELDKEITKACQSSGVDIREISQEERYLYAAVLHLQNQNADAVRFNNRVIRLQNASFRRLGSLMRPNANGEFTAEDQRKIELQERQSRALYRAMAQLGANAAPTAEEATRTYARFIEQAPELSISNTNSFVDSLSSKYQKEAVYRAAERMLKNGKSNIDEVLEAARDNCNPDEYRRLLFIADASKIRYEEEERKALEELRNNKLERFQGKLESIKAQQKYCMELKATADFTHEVVVEQRKIFEAKKLEFKNMKNKADSQIKWALRGQRNTLTLNPTQREKLIKKVSPKFHMEYKQAEAVQQAAENAMLDAESNNRLANAFYEIEMKSLMCSSTVALRQLASAL